MIIDDKMTAADLVRWLMANPADRVLITADNNEADRLRALALDADVNVPSDEERAKVRTAFITSRVKSMSVLRGTVGLGLPKETQMAFYDIDAVLTALTHSLNINLGTRSEK